MTACEGAIGGDLQPGGAGGYRAAEAWMEVEGPELSAEEFEVGLTADDRAQGDGVGCEGGGEVARRAEVLIGDRFP